MGEEAGRVKTVLPFAFEYGLSVEQFYFLLMNEAVFGQVRDITEAVSLSNAEVGWLVDNGPAFVLGQITNFLQNVSVRPNTSFLYRFPIVWQ